MNFDWRTEDETKWEDSPSENRPEGKPRRWSAALALILLLGLAAYTVYSQANRQVDVATAATEADVIAAYQLVHSAAVHSDRELFVSLLAFNYDRAWATTQGELFNQGLIAGLEPLGLQAQTTPPKVVRVNLSPDMTQAELLADWSYKLDNGETAVFRRSAAMALIAGRWRLIALDRTDAAGPLTYSGRTVTIEYPEEDHELVMRVADAVDRKVGEVCQATFATTGCDLRQPLELRLLADESYLSAFLANGYGSLMDRGFFSGRSLPTPAVIGTPLNEAAYRALVRAYASPLAALFVIVSLECDCEDRPLYRVALLNQELRRQGLNERLADFAEFSPAAAPVPLPAEDIQALCYTNYRGVSELYRYNLAEQQWTEELSMAGYYSALSPLPGRTGVMVRQEPVFYGETQPRTILWRDATEAAVFRNLYFGAADPTGQRLLMYNRDGDWSLVEDSMFHYGLTLFDLAECEAAADCSGEELTGYLVWSPDGQHTIIRQEEQTLWLGDGDGRPIRRIGSGVNPFWLDEQTYGFVNVSRTAVLTATLDAPRRVRLVTLPDLVTTLSAYLTEYGLAIGEVAVSPADFNLLFVTVNSQPPELVPTTRQSSYVFSFNQQTGEIIPRISREGGPRFSPPSFSPDGRWLTLSAFDEGDTARYLYLHNIAANQTTIIPAYSRYVFPVYHWSAGSDWLVLVNDGLLYLVAPDYNYHAVILPESPGCDFAAWVKK